MSVKPIELNEIEREKLRTIVKKGSDWRERERAQTVLMLSEGLTVLTVAEQQNVKPEAIRERRRKWLKKGMASLPDQPRYGAPPITPLAKKLLDNLWPYSGNSDYLFPSRYNEEKLIHKTSLAHAITRISSIDTFTPRDLRRTVKTRMGEIGIEKSIRDRIQNHALNDVSSKHYDRYDYLQEKRSALLKWEKHLIELNAHKNTFS